MSSGHVNRDPLVSVTFLPFQLAFSTYKTRYFWLQVSILSGGERVDVSSFPFLGETVVTIYFRDLTYHCGQCHFQSQKVYKYVTTRGTSRLWLWSGVIVLMLLHLHAYKTVLTRDQIHPH